MFNKKGLLKTIAMLMAVLIIMAVLVAIFQYKQADYIFRGSVVAATVVDGHSDSGSKVVDVVYINDDGEETSAKAVLKQRAKTGDRLNLIVTDRHTDVLYQIPSRGAIVAFDMALLLMEFIGWSFVMRLMRRLKKYKKLEKKGQKATATITSLKNTSGVLEADIEFSDGNGTKRTVVYCPDSDIPDIGDKLEIVYYIKRTGKVVYLVPKDE